MSRSGELDRIFIEDMELLVFLGAGPAERRMAQIVKVEIRAEVEMAGARRHDRLAQTLDYAVVATELRKIAAAKPYALVEHLGEAMLAVITAYPGVHTAEIRLRKPCILGEATPCVIMRGRRPTRVAIGLGANIGDPQRMMATALEHLRNVGEVQSVSSLYRTAPWGRTAQPDFLNAAAVLETTLLPHAVLLALKRIEAELGRRPGLRWGPRVIDLDVLDDEGTKVRDADLIVPHPRLFERAFVLVPLAEIVPHYQDALDQLSAEEQSGVTRVAEWPTWCANPDAS